MTALVRTTGRVARAAPGAATTPPPRRGAKRVLLLQADRQIRSTCNVRVPQCQCRA